jgi:hypothetical protein
MVAKRIIIATGLAVFGALLMSGCTTSQPQQTPAPQVTQALVPLTPTQQANQLLATVIAPPDATEVATAPNAELRDAAGGAICTPKIDVMRYWTVPNSTAQSVISYLSMHATRKFGFDGTGEDFVGKKLLMASATFSYLGESNSLTMLDYEAVPLDSNTVGVRADIYFIPSGATCVRSGLATPTPATT